MGTEYGGLPDLELYEDLYEVLNPDIEMNAGIHKFCVRNDNFVFDKIYYNLKLKEKDA